MAFMDAPALPAARSADLGEFKEEADNAQKAAKLILENPAFAGQKIDPYVLAQAFGADESFLPPPPVSLLSQFQTHNNLFYHRPTQISTAATHAVFSVITSMVNESVTFSVVLFAKQNHNITAQLNVTKNKARMSRLHCIMNTLSHEYTTTLNKLDLKTNSMKKVLLTGNCSDMFLQFTDYIMGKLLS